MSASHQFKPVTAAELRRLELIRRRTIRIGLAVIPYCEHQAAWLLPVGPAQVNRVVRKYDDALAFAQRMNDILRHYPQLAVRMERKQAA